MAGAVPAVPVYSRPPPAVVQPMPCVLSDDSSESSAAEEVAAASTSASEEMPTEVDGCSAKTPLAEELEAESDDRSHERSRGKTVVEPPHPSAPLVFEAPSNEALEDATGALGSLLGLAKDPWPQAAGGAGTSRRDSGIGEGENVPAAVGYWGETLHSLCQEAEGRMREDFKKVDVLTLIRYNLEHSSVVLVAPWRRL